MSKLYSSRAIVKILERYGFVFVSQKGSHIKLRKFTSIKTLTAIVPANRKEVSFGTYKSILLQSELSEEEFSKKK